MSRTALKTVAGIALMSLMGSFSVNDASAARRRNDDSNSKSCSSQQAAQIRSSSIAHIESTVYDFSRYCDYKTNYYQQKISYSLRCRNHSAAQYYLNRATYELQQRHDALCSYIQGYGAHYGNYLNHYGYTEYANHIRHAADEGCSHGHGKLGHCLGILRSTYENGGGGNGQPR